MAAMLQDAPPFVVLARAVPDRPTTSNRKQVEAVTHVTAAVPSIGGANTFVSFHDGTEDAERVISAGTGARFPDAPLLAGDPWPPAAPAPTTRLNIATRPIGPRPSIRFLPCEMSPTAPYACATCTGPARLQASNDVTRSGSNGTAGVSMAVGAISSVSCPSAHFASLRTRALRLGAQQVTCGAAPGPVAIVLIFPVLFGQKTRLPAPPRTT
jgi:hypothetical protein